MPSSNEKTVKETVATGGDRILTKDEQKAAWKKCGQTLVYPSHVPVRLIHLAVQENTSPPTDNALAVMLSESTPNDT
jgi:hypothetical protein